MCVPDTNANDPANVPRNGATPLAPLSFIFDPDEQPPAESVIYEGFLSAGDLVTWIGREKHRKTNLLLQLAICAAIGRDFLGFRFRAPEPLRVTFVDYET